MMIRASSEGTSPDHHTQTEIRLILDASNDCVLASAVVNRMKECGASVGLAASSFESNNHACMVLQGLNSLRDKQLLFDVTLIVDGQRFEAHRAVLASCSDYFRAMFTDAMRERQQDQIWLNGVSPVGLELVLNYAYTSKITLNLSNLQCVLSAASHLQIIELINACSDYLRSQLEIDNCVDIITISETYSLLALRKYSYCYLAQHLDKLTYLPEFQRISLAQLEHVLSNDYAVECAEYDVLYAVLCWIQYDLAQRSLSTMRLLSHIRFVDIPHTELRALMETPMFAMIEGRCAGLRTFINGARFVSVKVNRECPSLAKGLVNCRGLEPAIVNVGGFQSSTGVTNSVTYYHKSSGCWKHLTDVPHVEQCNFGMAVLNNELYVVGGCFNLTLQENTHPFGFKYSPRTNEWKSIAPMLLERGGFYLAAVSGRLYVIGGVGDMIDPDDNMPCESYHPETDQWSAIAAMPGCREQQAGASYGTEVFISGGLEWDEVIDSLISYNVETDIWHTRSPMRTPRADHAMTAYDGKLYVAGGWIDDPDINNRLLIHDVDCYDLITNQWQTLTHVPTPRYLASLVALDKTLYFIGGFEQSGLFDGFENNGFNRGTKKIEQYNLDDSVWISEESYPVAIWEHLSCVLHIPVYREDAELGQLLAANNNSNDKRQTRSSIIF